MNDFWNDPPEQPEPPECCDEIMDVDKDGICHCQKCGNRIEPQPEIEPPDIEGTADMIESVLMEDLAEHCPHGNEWGSCDACDVASDIAYDTARERR
jgi:hypothetical protein